MKLNPDWHHHSHHSRSPGVNVIKLLIVVIYYLLQYARGFASCQLFRPSVMFAYKAGAYQSGLR